MLTVPLRFGGPANVARTVRQYVSAGVAGMHIEDQVQTKRCGHLLGKQVVSREEFLTRIRAAVIARDSIPGGSDFVSALDFCGIHRRPDRILGHHWTHRFGSSARDGGGYYPTQTGC